MIRRRPVKPRGQGVNGQPYAPYPLLDFEQGLFDAKESWLAPRGAWDELHNAHAFRGRIHKRPGYSFLGELCRPLASPPEVLEACTVKSIYTGNLANTVVCSKRGNYATTFDTTDATTQQVVDSGIIDPRKLAIDNGNAAVGFIAYTDGTWLVQEVTDPGHTITAGTYSLVGVTGYNDEPPIPNGLPILAGSITITDSSGTPKVLSDVGTNGASGILKYDADGSKVGDVDYEPLGYSSAGQLITNLVLPGGWTNPAAIVLKQEAGFLTLDDGAYDITFRDDTTAAGNLTCDYEYNEGRPVMGIRSFNDRSGNEYTVALDTRGVYLYNAARDAFERVDPALADPFSGTDDDFPWMEAFEDTLRITNGVDPPKVYTPTGAPPHVVDAGRDFDGDTTDELDSARIVLRAKDNSLIYLYTVESGTAHPQRARFTDVNDVDYASATAATAELWADCPAEDVIVTAERHGDDFIVGFSRSFWRLAYTGQPQLPYEWRRIPLSDGAVAKMATAELAEEILTRGRTGIVSVDAVGETPLDNDVPDIALGWSADNAHYSYSHHSREFRQVLFSFADQSQDFPSKAFVVQYDDKRTRRTFATYDFPFHSIGEYNKIGTLLWDDLTDLMDNYDFTLDSPDNSPGFPIVLVGDRSGNVYEWGVSNSDEGNDIEATIRSTRLNPFPFRRAHLGYVDLVFGYQQGHVLKLNVYGDFQAAPYFTTTVDTSQTTGNITTDGKLKRRIPINKIASWHAVELVENSKIPFKLDAVVPYFRPAGLMRNVSL